VRPVFKIFVNPSLFASGSGRMKLDIPIHMSVLKVVKKMHDKFKKKSRSRLEGSLADVTYFLVISYWSRDCMSRC
jgi:hypothetical protein